MAVREPCVKPLKKLKLQDFNNLTKSLCFNLYDVCFASTPEQRRHYLEYIDEEYNADELTTILERVAEIIGATVLNTARQDYDPQGASVTMLISEGPVDKLGSASEQDALLVGERTADCVVQHLDKSHLTVHTYPEQHPHLGICTFRADIEVSTCGKITPLHALNDLLRTFDSDVLSIDYTVRGFTRDIAGRKHFIDHHITSIQDFIAEDILNAYQAVDVNMYQRNIFHTDLMWKDLDVARYLFDGKKGRDALKKKECTRIRRLLKKELEEIFYGRNLK